MTQTIPRGTTARGSVLLPVPLGRIRSNPHNPRTTFDEAALDELAQSIAAHGILEPLVAREIRVDGSFVFELIAGERRFRAAQKAGLETVPVRVLPDVDDATARELALLENLQRQDLTPIEEAEGFAALVAGGVTVAELARRLGKSAPAVSNRIRLLKLPEEVRQLIRDGKLSAAHGVALLRYEPFPRLVAALARLSVEQGWTAHRLEGKDLLADWALERLGVLETFGGTERFERTVCQACPFGAYRTAGYRHVCLQPSHYAELRAEEERARAEETRRRIAEVEASGRQMLRLEDLRYDQYERLDWSHNRAEGCGEACTCRRDALDQQGKLVSICIEPRRLAQLKAAATREAKRAASAQVRARLQQVLDRLDALDGITARDLAIVAAAALAQVGTPTSAREAFTRHGLTGLVTADRVTRWDWRKRRFAQFAGVDVVTLARATLEALLRDELAQCTEPGASSTPWVAWWLDGTLPPDDDSARNEGVEA